MIVERKKAVEYALQTHRLEGFNYTAQEKVMWNKIANGELALSAAFEDAEDYIRQLREKHPEVFEGGESCG